MSPVSKFSFFSVLYRWIFIIFRFWMLDEQKTNSHLKMSLLILDNFKEHLSPTHMTCAIQTLEFSNICTMFSSHWGSAVFTLNNFPLLLCWIENISVSKSQRPNLMPQGSLVTHLVSVHASRMQSQSVEPQLQHQWRPTNPPSLFWPVQWRLLISQPQLIVRALPPSRLTPLCPPPQPCWHRPQPQLPAPVVPYPNGYTSLPLMPSQGPSHCAAVNHTSWFHWEQRRK